MRHTRILLALLAGLLAGCDQTIDPPVPDPPDGLAVTAVLRPGTPSQHLLLTRLRRATHGPGQPANTYVQNARVRVGEVVYRNLPLDSLSASPDRLGDGNYASEMLVVEPGRSYELKIRQGGRRITGQATVPDTFRVNASGPFSVSWTESAGADLYDINLFRLEDSVSVFIRNNLTEDTSLNLAENFEPPHRGQSEHPESHGPESYVLTIHALDSHMTAFQRKHSVDLTEDLQVGIQGAYGLFGAITTMRDTVELGMHRSSKATNRRGGERPFLFVYYKKAM